MTDIYNIKKRSNIMSRISGKDTKPELIVRKHLFSRGFRFKKNVVDLPGKPDVVLPKYNSIIFIHGCFWHGHKHCNASKLPATNSKFWKDKINANIVRDKKNITRLRNKDWKVFVIWQCEIINKVKREYKLEKIVGKIRNNL